MAEWPLIELGACAEFQEGYVNPSQQVSDYFDGPVKWLRAVDLNDSYVGTTSRTLSQRGFESAGKSAKLFEPGTLAISKSGTIGRLGILTDHMCGNRAVINIKVNEKVCLPRIAFYALLLGRAQIETLAEGSVQKNLYVSALAKFKFRLPPLDRQFEIDALAGSIDDKIELNRHTNETLEAMAQAIFRDWFVNFGPVRRKLAGERDPVTIMGGLIRDPARAAELAELFPDALDDNALPESWRLASLANLADLNPQVWSTRTAPETIRYVDLTNTKWGTIEAIAVHTWDEAPSRARRVVRPGDTLVATVRPGNGSYAYVSDDGLTASTGFAHLRPKRATFQSLVYFAATLPENIDRLSHLADGGAYPAINPDLVLSTEIVLGTDQVLAAFNAAVGPLHALIEHNKGESRTLAEARDYLLPRLMSGKVRVVSLETSDQQARTS